MPERAASSGEDPRRERETPREKRGETRERERENVCEREGNGERRRSPNQSGVERVPMTVARIAQSELLPDPDTLLARPTWLCSKMKMARV